MARSRQDDKSQKRKSSGQQRGRSNRKDNRGWDKSKGRKERDDSCRNDSSYRSDGRTSSLNDLSWYSRNPNLLVAAGQFPYPYRPGMQVPLAVPAADQVANVFNPTIPGVMALDWCPSFGNSVLSTDPASIAGKEFYGRVRAAFSGAIDADAPDFVTYVGALDSIFTYIGWLKRIYRAISSYTPDNFMLPDGVLHACFYQYTKLEPLRTDKVRLWQGINELILMSRKFKCPAVMDLFNRHYWMSDNVYADADSARAQLYLFNVVGVWTIGDVTEASSGETISGLVMKALPRSGNISVDALINFGKALIQALDAWDDGYLISGYLQRAFESVPSFSVAELMQDELLTVSYVPEVLQQIENCKAGLPCAASVRPIWSDDRFSGMYVSQNVSTNAVVCSAKVKYYADVPSSLTSIQKFLPEGVGPMLNIRSEAPTVADNVIASRLHAHVIYGAVTTDKLCEATFTAGTELPLAWTLVSKTPGSDTWSEQPIWNEYELFLDQVSTNQQLFMKSLFSLGQFDWHPMMYVLTPYNRLSAGVAGNITISINGDVHNMTPITVASLANLHKICLYSELNSFGI